LALAVQAVGACDVGRVVDEGPDRGWQERFDPRADVESRDAGLAGSLLVQPVPRQRADTKRRILRHIVEAERRRDGDAAGAPVAREGEVDAAPEREVPLDAHATARGAEPRAHAPWRRWFGR